MNLVINSQFRPFTYDEMVKPLVQYKEAYDKVEQSYADLLEQTETWKSVAEREKNPRAFERFNKYSNDLESIVDDFSKGMNMNNRRALLGLKRRYHKEIEPIAKASKKIDELAAEQRKLAASNPNIMFDRDFSSEVSVDQMMENPNLSYRVIDGNDLYSKGAAISKAMSSRLHKVDPALRGQYWEIRKGFGEEAANKFLLDSGAIPELNKALEDLVGTTNAPDNLKGRAFEYARQGAISGMVSDVSYQSNRGYESPAEAAKRADSHELAMMQMGKIPYREDPDGTKHYVNTAANTTWSVDKNNKVTEGSKPTGGTRNPEDEQAVMGRLTPDTAIGGSVLKDSKNPSHKYIIGEDGKPHRLSSEELRVMGKSSTVRINTYKNERASSPSPSEVAMFRVDGNGNLKMLSRDKNKSDYEDMYRNLSKNKVVNLSSYLGGDLNSDAAKSIKAALEGTPLTLDDIEIVSNMDTKPLLFNEVILVRTKNSGSASSARSQVTSK